MFESGNVLQELLTRQALYCVWIRANETPGAPLISVWIDSKMRVLEGAGQTGRTLAVGAEPAEEAPESRPTPLTVDDVKYGVQ